MSKEEFVHKQFGREAMQIIHVAEEICDDYADQGYDLSLRQLYYQFVSRDLLANTEKNYKRLGNIISDARLAGLIDWDAIKDRGRETISNSHWTSIGDIIRACANKYNIDLWDTQYNHVELMVEKQALEGVLEPVCRRWDIGFTANKGYSSSSALYETGKRLAEKGRRKDLHVIYLGDHDPSGIDMTRDVEDRLCLFSNSYVEVHRIALNMDQVELYNPPENPAKLTDSRAAEYIRNFGDSSWELDALEPRVLVSLVEQKIKELVDQSLFDESITERDVQRAKLQEIADNHGGC